ncbi:MAG: glucose-6-phosphate isomerase [Oscillospiraceae bacterium]|nr:glucose-6-phosphate isomerase [Oscillospiraceae bacterium]
MLTINTAAITAKEFESFLPAAQRAHDNLQNGTGRGSDFTGWVKLPESVDKDELARIKAAAAKIRSDSEVLLVIGIGGSYLGARAVIEALRGTMYNLKDKPMVLFAGNNLSASYYKDIMALLEGRDFSINVISKSGTTTEPAVAFRIFRRLLEQRYGKEGAKSRIYATTDKARGALKGVADAMGYETFVIPDDVGGRYSVLTPVGLLPIAAAGIDIDALLLGAADMMKICRAPGEGNPAWRYAIARNAMLGRGKTTEILVTYDPDFVFLAEWYKQLFGESEGKEQKGIYPSAVSFTADLHSMGQFIQEGARSLFETAVLVDTPAADVRVGMEENDADGLNFLAGKSLFDIERQAFRGTYLAHGDGGTPNLVVKITDKNARDLGGLLYFFEYSCGVSGYILGVNPFDQPGVEAYKKNMFALLDKPGFEKEGAQLTARLPEGI